MRRLSIDSSLKTMLLALAILSASLPGAFAQGPGSSGGSSAGGNEKPSGVEARSEGGGSAPAVRSGTASTGRLSSAWLEAAIAEFDRWLAVSPEGRRLLPIQARLKAVAASVFKAGVPPDALVTRLREAVAKQAAFETIALAVEIDATYWIRVSEMVGSGDWPPSAKASRFYLTAGSALRNGLGEPAVAEAIKWARAPRGSTDRTVAAMTTIASVAVALGAGNTESAVMVRELVGSRLKASDFGNVAALAARAAGAGMGATWFATSLADVLGSGGSLRDLEKRLFP